MNLEETVMMMRAICSSEKGPTVLKELSNEFKNMTGTNVPFKILGFSSLTELLESQPDKFTIITDKYTNEIAVQPVIDSELSTLRSLVTGQKSKKKKKPSKINKTGYSKYKHFQVYRQSYYHKPFCSRMKDKSPQPFHKSSPIQSAKTVRFDPNIKFSEFDSSERSKVSKEIIEQLTISNAAYFLNEHQVLVTHIVDCEQIYMMLVSDNFSEKYDKMFKTMNEFYFKSRKVPPSYQNKGNICIAFDGFKYIRVQIKNFKDNLFECFHLDEGNSSLYSINQLYEIDEQFLTVKFQAVKAKLEKLDILSQNSYLQDHIKKEICNKKFIAKKTQSNPLKIYLYDAENICINDQLLQHLNIFINFKPIQNFFIDTTITYIDLESKLIYLENPNNQVFTLHSHQLNSYFYDEQNKLILKSLNQEAKLRISKDDFNTDELFCARFSVDLNWYRVKYIREKKTSNQFFVLFVDFGNKDFVSTEEFCIFPKQFTLLKNLPFQCFPGTLMNSSANYDFFKNLWFDNVVCKFKIVHINPTGIPTIEFVDTLNEEAPNLTENTKIEDELVEKVNKIDLNNNNNQPEMCASEQISEDDIVTIDLSTLREIDLPTTALVYFKYVNNPFDFVINLVSKSNMLENLKENMRNFYQNKPEKYQVTNLEKNCIYAYQNEDFECFRVQFCGKIHNYAKVYFVDDGYYDAVKIKNLFFLKEKFTQLPSMAIKAKLANIECNQGNIWSKEARNYFFKLADKTKTFKSSIVKYIPQDNSFEIELSDNSIGLLSDAMVQAKYAIPKI